MSKDTQRENAPLQPEPTKNDALLGAQPARLSRIGFCYCRYVLFACVLFCGVQSPGADERSAAEPATEIPTTPAPDAGAADKDQVDEIRRLIRDLDADSFTVRDRATRELAALGSVTLPHLCQALGDPSAELKQRAGMLLAQTESFDELVPHLLKAIDQPGATVARRLLKERCLHQIEAAAQLTDSERLFKYWGMDVDQYRTRAMAAFEEAKTSGELARVVEPLVDLRSKAERLSDLVSRLTDLSLATDSRHSPGYGIMEAAARGFCENRPEYVAFATSYVDALENLARELRERGDTTHKIRQELTSRADWCREATIYLMQLLDPQSQPARLVTGELAISRAMLQEHFFTGLSSADPQAFADGVGRVHIVDLLGEALQKWPQAPNEGVAAAVKERVIDCVKVGNKPKALVYLNVLDACQKLTAARLNLPEGLGNRLANRLLRAADTTDNLRQYSPARRFHDQVLALANHGIPPGHQAFPQELLQGYLQQTVAIPSEQDRLSLERYVFIVDRVTSMKTSLEQPRAIHFLQHLRVWSTQDPDKLAKVIQQLDQLPRQSHLQTGPAQFDDFLAKWIAEGKQSEMQSNLK